MRLILITGVLFLTLAMPAAAALDNPYTILEHYYEALGGLDKLMAQRSSHASGTVELVGTGLGGTFDEWTAYPILSRQEADLGILQQTQGDNGEFAWDVDHNGKLTIREDERTLGLRRIKLLEADYAHLDSESEVFDVELIKIDTTGGGHTCYKVQITNTINDDVTIHYIDTTSFLVIKTVQKEPDGQQHTLYTDYREVDGITMAYKTTTTLHPTGLVQEAVIELIELNIEIDPSLFEPPTADVQDFRFATGWKAEDIPFEFIEGHIYLPLTVGGNKRLWVLDSGAGATCLEKKFADELGAESEGESKAQGAGSLVDVEWMRMPEYSLPGLEFDGQKVVALDIEWLFRRWVDLDVAGILGYDFLSRLVTKIDYANERLSFYHPDSFVYDGDGVVIDAPVGTGNMFHLPVTVDGQYGGKWNLDLGANGMDFHYPFAEEHGLLDCQGVQRMSAGAGGAGMSHSCQFETIEFAGFELSEPVVSMPDGAGEGAFHGADLTGNIGNWLLRHFVLYLDYKRGQVIVEKGDDFGRDFPRDHSGLQIQRNDGGKIDVFFVAPGTPAEEAGFMVGDVIKYVNGTDIVEFASLREVREAFQAEPGTEVTVSVTRLGRAMAIRASTELR